MKDAWARDDRSVADSDLARLRGLVLAEARVSGVLEKALSHLLDHPRTPHDLSGLTEIGEALDVLRDEIRRGVDLPRPDPGALEIILRVGLERRMPPPGEPPSPSPAPLPAPEHLARRALARMRRD